MAERITFGERAADAFSAGVGCWRFIIAQTVILALWICANTANGTPHWDIYPFILLNLVLSFQAAYSAPIIMMSQNRQAAIDRRIMLETHDAVMKELALVKEILADLQGESGGPRKA